MSRIFRASVACRPFWRAANSSWQCAQEKYRQSVGGGDVAQGTRSMITFIDAENKHIERELSDHIQIKRLN